MGLMATAVGKEVVAPMVQDIMQAALKVYFHTALLCLPVHMPPCEPGYLHMDVDMSMPTLAIKTVMQPQSTNVIIETNQSQ